MWYALCVIDCDTAQCVEFLRTCPSKAHAMQEVQEFVRNSPIYSDLTAYQLKVLHNKYVVEVEGGCQSYIGELD